MKKITLLFTILISVLAIQISFAAPSLTIIKPPVTPVPSWTGPGIPLPPLAPTGDPHAELGQWFTDRATGSIFERRTHEFYDNVDPNFGGGYASFFAIYGYVSAIVGGGGGPIFGFDITATISNDIPALSPWLAGANSHGEQRAFTSLEDQKFVGTLLDVKLTAEFSIDPAVPFPAPFLPPYFDPYPDYIEAVNHDQLAWYCWTSENPEDLIPWGDFHVPTWDFGSIPQGGSKTRVMSFQIITGLQPGDPRYLVIQDSFDTGDDILLNRTTSLKISEWIEDLVGDTAVPYPDNPNTSSDVSVFHNIPEPGIIAGITLIILGLYRQFTK